MALTKEHKKTAVNKSSLSNFSIANFDEQDICFRLKSDGFCIVNNYVDHIEKLKPECDILLDSYKEQNNRGVYAFGDVAIANSPTDLQENAPNIFELFHSAPFKKVFRYFSDNDAEFCKQIYYTHDYTMQRGLARNGYLHFDRMRSIKFLLYLSDVNVDSGPFSVVPGSHFLGAKLRQKSNEETKQYEEVKNRIDIDFPDVVPHPEQLLPIVGNAGTLIVFDTDIFHLGGLVKEGHERKLMRSHCFC